MDDQNKNLILATALSFLVILVWFLLFPPEQPEVTEATTQSGVSTPATDQTTGAELAVTPPAASEATATTSTTTDTVSAVEDVARLPIETPKLEGSISLLGGRIDDLSLRDYNETLAEDSPIVRLLSPVGSVNAYYALYGWTPGGTLTFDDVPGANSEWRVESGETLGVGSPVTLRWDNSSGLIFRRTVSVDEDYLFTVDQTVENTTSDPVRLQPYGIVARHSEPDTIGFFILHEGIVGMQDGELIEANYDDMTE